VERVHSKKVHGKGNEEAAGNVDQTDRAPDKEMQEEKRSKLMEIKGPLIKYIIENKSNSTFSTLLDEYRKHKGISSTQLYESAFIDRRHYSKIMGDRFYRPNKKTVIALGLALHLNKAEILDLLKSAGFILTESSVFDLIIKFCIESKIYDISFINDILSIFEQGSLGKIIT
jgi:hypothetical protein